MTGDARGTGGSVGGWVLGGVLASSVAAGSLLLPWVSLGRRQFSSLDLVSTASALDIIEGGQKRLVLVCWMMVPALAAAGYLLAALGRHRMFGCALLPLGPIYIVVAFGMSTNTPATADWGLQLGVAAGAFCTVIGVLLVRRAVPR